MSLSVNYSDLQKAISRYLGYKEISGSDDASREWADIEDCIRSGLRQFYNPPLLPGQEVLYQWRFLRPVDILALSFVNTTGNYDLPDDLGGIIGGFTFVDSQPCQAIKIIGEASLRSMRQRCPKNGKPQYGAVRAKKSDGTSQQLQEVIFYPIPDEDISLEYQYFVLPNSIGSDNPYPYGCDAHGETIIESCLSKAEQRLNDQKGLHWQNFTECLSASIKYDMKTNSIEFFGYNGDSSDGRGLANNSRFDLVMVNGEVID